MENLNVKNLDGLDIKERGVLAKNLAKMIITSEGIDVKPMQQFEYEADRFVSETNELTCSSVGALSRRGEMTQTAMNKLTEITKVAEGASNSFKNKTFLGIPLKFLNKNKLMNVSLKLKDANELIGIVSTDLNEFEHTLKGDIVTLKQNIEELTGYSKKMRTHIDFSKEIVLNIEEMAEDNNNPDFLFKMTQVNKKIAIKEKKLAVINTAILQLGEQRRSAYDIVENVKDTKDIIPLMLSVSALVASGADTQKKIQNTLTTLNEKTNKMFMENIDSQMNLSKEVKTYNVIENDKEVISKIEEFVKHIDKNKNNLLSTKQDIESKIKRLGETNKKLNEAISNIDELHKMELGLKEGALNGK